MWCQAVAKRLIPALQQGSKRRIISIRYFSLINPNYSVLEDRCNRFVVTSPYLPIKCPDSYCPPLAEFITKDWIPGGHLGDKIACVDGSTGMSRTFNDYRTISSNIAAALHDWFGSDDNNLTVALFSGNHIDYLPIVLGISLVGAKVTPVNPLFTSRELKHILKESRTSVLICHKDQVAVALDATNNNNMIKHIVVITDGGDENSVPEGTISLDSINSQYNSVFFTETVKHVHPYVATHPVVLPYSFGTTGPSKGVSLTHKNIVTNLLQLEAIEAPDFPPDHSLISPLPMFHIYAHVVSMMYTAWKGHTLITMSGRFNLEIVCQLVEEHRPQRAHLVPPLILHLSNNPVVEKYDMSLLQMILSAAAPLPIDIETDVKDRLGCKVKEAWGMSELSPIGFINSDSGNLMSGSVGKLVPNTSAKIIDKKGNSLEPNKPGEILIKGPQVMMGYLHEPERTKECLSESGWLSTGDVAYYDDEGYFFIVDRLKELIKVRGYQVPPAELEALLLGHTQIRDVAVISKPDETSGELPRAYVVLEDGCSITEKDIFDWVKERVAPYKRLYGGIVFTDVIPKSASGKILRRLLRDQLKEEMEQA